MRLLILVIAVLGCADGAVAKPATPMTVVCGTQDMVDRVGPALVNLTPLIVKASLDVSALVSAEKALTTPVYVCALQRASALVSINGGPQYLSLEVTVTLLKAHAATVRVNVKSILSKRSIIFAPVTPPTTKRK